MNENLKQGSYTDLLTVAMPCYERKEFFPEALESILNQTVKCKVIVVDNNSSHDYFEKNCREKGVTYYRNETNIGLYPNINRCFELAETEYVKILDDDDLLSPFYVESFLKAKELHPNIDVYFSDYNLLTHKGIELHKNKLPFGYLKTGEKIIEYGIKYNLGFPYMSSVIKKTKVHKAEDIKDWVGGYDWVWIYSNAEHLTFYGDERKLYQFRIHGNQAHHKDWAAHTLTTSYIYDKILQIKVTDKELMEKAQKNSFRDLIYLKSHGNKTELKNILKTSKNVGVYLNSKLNENTLLKVLFMLPKSLVRFYFTIFRMNSWLKRRIYTNTK